MTLHRRLAFRALPWILPLALSLPALAATADDPLEDIEQLVVDLERAELGQKPSGDLPDDPETELSKVSELLDSHIAENPDDIRGLLLSARADRLLEMITPVMWSPAAGESPPKSALGEASSRLDHALELEPDNPLLHYWQARLYAVQEPTVVDGTYWERPRDLDLAIVHAERAVALDDDVTDYRDTLLVLLAIAGRLDELESVAVGLGDESDPARVILRDMNALPLPEAAAYSKDQTATFLDLQMNRGRYDGKAYPVLRVRVYLMQRPADELETSLRSSWPELTLFEARDETSEDGMRFRTLAQGFKRKKGQLTPAKTIKKVEKSDLLLSVAEVTNPSEEILERFGLDPVELFTVIYLMHVR